MASKAVPTEGEIIMMGWPEAIVAASAIAGGVAVLWISVWVALRTREDERKKGGE